LLTEVIIEDTCQPIIPPIEKQKIFFEISHYSINRWLESYHSIFNSGVCFPANGREEDRQPFEVVFQLYQRAGSAIERSFLPYSDLAHAAGKPVYIFQTYY